MTSGPTAHASDARLLRRVRWRLVAWSGGLTLAILLVLGSLVYVVVSNSLESSNVDALRQRADDLAAQVKGGPGQGQPSLGPRFGGGQNGTFGFIVGPSGRQGPQDFDAPAGLPDSGSIDAARANGADLRTATVANVPVRIFSERAPAPARGLPTIVQVVQDRTAELNALQLLALVLVVGGLAAVLLSLAAGALYAGRALVPIRESLGRQREFAANASHELRTPLAIVRTSLEYLRRHRDEPVSAVGEALDDIETEVGRLTGLVDDLLVVARADSGALELAPEPLDLADVAAEAAGAANVLATRAGAKILLDLRPAATVGDPARLRQLATILIDNAVRHAPAGSTITVSVGASVAGTTLAVEDEGPGIRPEDLPHVFERFWQASDGPAGGSGLGLSIAAWIVQGHGGTIAAENRQPHGAIFTVRLPAHG